MKKYEKYKEIESMMVNRIPENWKFLPLKYVARFYTGNSLNDAEKEKFSEFVEDSLPYISTKDISSVDQSADYANGIYIPTTEATYKVAPKGSFLICIEGGSAGKKMTSLSQDVCFVNKLCCIDAIEDKKYLYYAFQSAPFQADFKQSMQGLIGGVSISKLGDLRFAIPSLPEQQKIAEFLDYKTGKIDRLVEMLRERVDDLKKYRQSVITETVTRGLKMDAVLKDSGVDWIGSIPEGWKVVPLKTLLRLLTDGTHQTPTYLPSGVPFISIKDMSSGVIDFSDTKFISEEEHKSLSLHAPIEKGDIIFSRIGTLGVFIKVDTDEVFDIFVSLGLMKLIPGSVNADYLVYYLSSSVVKNYINLVKAGEGTSAAKFNLGDVKETRIVMPSLSEQQAIAEYLDKKTKEIDACVAATEARIQDLQKYRTSLISEAVTGQIDVR